MHRASDRVEQADWIDELREAADELGLSDPARSRAVDLFLSGIPDADRSKPAVVAASLYAGGLLAGEERSQTAVANAVGVSRLSVSNRWKPLLEEAGFDPPSW
jgi:transcription initiation factor TFIIIB Brf1 subunit/transcription initiation factor TFIIB